MKQFEITLKNEKRKSYKKSQLAVVILNLLAFLFLAYTTKDSFSQKRALITVGVIIFSILLDFLFRKKKLFFAKHAAIVFSIYSYLSLRLYWPAIAVALIAFLFFLAMRIMIVRFTNNHIVFPSFPEREIQWQELNNVLLKDELLTIDFKNNKLIQQYADPELTNINEKEFNDFCREQLQITATQTSDHSS